MILDRNQAPKIYEATDFEFELQAIQKRIFSNDIPCYFFCGGVQEVLSIQFYFNAGAMMENQKGLAKICASQILSGTKDLTALELSTKFEQLGASIKVFSNNDYGVMQLSCLSRHVYELLPLLKEIISASVFPEQEWEIYKSQNLEALKVNLKKSDFIANRKIDEVIYGSEHPYGQFMEAEDYFAINVEQLRTFYKQYYAQAAFEIYVSGNFDLKLIDTLENIFGKEERKRIVKNNFIIKGDATKIHHIAHDKNNVQASIRLGQTFIPKDDPNYIPFSFVNTLFGAYFGSRLMTNIREDKGYTYGIYSYIQSQEKQSAIMIATEAGRDVSEACVQEIFNEMKRLREEAVEEEELQLVKNYILGSVLSSLSGPFEIMNRWVRLIQNGFDQKRFYNSIEIYKRINSKQIQELANLYLREEDYYQVVVA